MRSALGLLFKLLPHGMEPGQLVTRLEVHRALSGCRSVLDVGCGRTSLIGLSGFERTVGLEGYLPDAEAARHNRTHDEIVVGDARDLEQVFGQGKFDACIALDVIEHLPKEEGLKMMRSMEAVSTRKTIFVTPSGFLPQGHTETGDLQAHLSGWEPDEMRRLGYRVIGLLGPKSFRGEYHSLKRRPKAFWGLVSLLGHFLYTRWKPEKAAAILCVKER
jgi:hypothetical protein